MKYLEQREPRTHGTFEYPFGYYNIRQSHPRYHMVAHWHPEYEIIRIKKGEFDFTLNGNKYIGHENDLFIVPDGALHGGIPRNCHYECLVFSLQTVLEMSAVCMNLAKPVLIGSSYFRYHIVNCDERLRHAVDRLFNYADSEQEFAPFQVVGSFFCLIGLLLQGYTESSLGKENLMEMRSLARIKDVMRLIRNHYHEEISLNDMAQTAHMNKQYFCQYFRKVMGQTPIRYLNYYRIECACELLANSGRTVSEVASACGFKSDSYFIKVFHSLKDVTPNIYANAL